MFTGLLGDAHDMAKEAVSLSSAILSNTPRMSLSREAETLRWFYFPHEDASAPNSSALVITPKQYSYGRTAGEGRNVSFPAFSFACGVAHSLEGAQQGPEKGEIGSLFLFSYTAVWANGGRDFDINTKSTKCQTVSFGPPTVFLCGVVKH